MSFASWLRTLKTRLDHSHGRRPRRPQRRRAAPALEALEDRTVPSTFTVTTTADSGAGSLRQAILDANANPDTDTIAFAIPGSGVRTIKPLTQLPVVTDPAVLDATTQPGYSGTPLVELDGSTDSTSGSAGLWITAGHTTVKGFAINRFAGYGIVLGGYATDTGDVIQGNFIGTDPTGTTAEGNGLGIMIYDRSSQNLIGTDGDGVNDAAERNIISGNGGPGILVLGTGTSQNIVAGNYVGTDVTGKVALGNGGGYAAILIDGGATNNRVGASSADADPAGERNIISGNKDVGVEIYGAGSNPNLIAGNYIGTDVAGAAALGNANWGVWVGSGASDNTVGGTAAGARKVIAGNRGGGLGLIYSGTTGNQVLGNFIGTDAAGSASLPNSFYGVAVSGADNTIGGTAAGAGNLISGNGYVGVDIEGSGTTGNQILGNRIGTDACGTAALANPGWGVYIRDGASGNSVGGTAAGAGNTIAFNGTGGVVVFSGTGNSILANSVFANGGPGIDLGDDGVTLNGSRGQSGPNFYQVFPVLSSADISNGSATIQGSLTASPNTTYRVEFFANAAGDPSGYGEGQTFLGWAAVTTDGTGSASFTTTLPVPAGELVLTATATDPIGDTSEFSHWINPRPTTTGLSR